MSGAQQAFWPAVSSGYEVGRYEVRDSSMTSKPLASWRRIDTSCTHVCITVSSRGNLRTQFSASHCRITGDYAEHICVNVRGGSLPLLLLLLCNSTRGWRPVQKPGHSVMICMILHHARTARYPYVHHVLFGRDRQSTCSPPARRALLPDKLAVIPVR